MILKAFCILAAALLLAPVPAAAAEAFYKASLGPYNMVLSQDVNIPFDGRKRGLDVHVTYPQKGKNLPLIIFSHGAFGSGTVYAPLATYWASHGYVVMQPTHADSTKNGTLPLLNNPLSFRNWKERPAEITHIIDELGLITKMVPALDSVMDEKTIAVGGHSYGAHTAQLLAGMTVRRPFNFTNDKRRSFRDARIGAFLMISPYGEGMTIDDESYKTMDQPALFVTGTNDSVPTNGDAYTWRLSPFRLSDPHDKYLLFIDGAFHGFGGIVGANVRWKGAGPANLDDVNAVRCTSLAFFDAYLKNDTHAKAYLSLDVLRKESGGKIQVTTR